MATASFTRKMKFNKKESEALIKFLESDSKSNYKLQTPVAKEASKETIEKLFRKK